MKNLFAALFLLTLVSITGGVAFSGEPLDLSTPEKTFKSLQKALKNHNASTLAQIMSDMNSTPEKHKEFVEEFAVASKEQAKSNLFMGILINGSFVRVEERETKKDKAGKSYPRCIVWIIWSEKKKIAWIDFLRHGKTWRFTTAYLDTEPVADAPDFSSPKKSFFSVNQAIRFYGSSPTFLYDSIDSRLRKSIVLKKYVRAVKEADGADNPILQGYTNKTLEVEKIKPDKTRRVRVRVWMLGKDGKREGVDEFEIFVKDRGKWKWIPKKEYSWYPRKPKKPLKRKNK